MRLLDSRFVYRNSASTNIAETWKAHGWQPTTDEQRAAQQIPRALREPSEIQVPQPGKRKIAPPALRLTVKQ